MYMRGHCQYCGKEFVKLVSSEVTYSPSDQNRQKAIFKWTLEVIPNSGASLPIDASGTNVSFHCSTVALKPNQGHVKPIIKDGNRYTYTYEVDYDPSVLREYSIGFDTNNTLMIDNKPVHFYGYAQTAKFDCTAPTNISCTATPSTQINGFSNKVTITAKVKETFSDIVYMGLYDSNGTSMLVNWKTAVEGEGDIFTGTFDAIVETRGNKILYVESKDEMGNKLRQPVTISNVDSKAPTYAGADGNTDTWTKMKNITFKAKDGGIGDVSIAFNNESDYEKATLVGDTYQRSYLFTGDVYGKVTGAVYFKDGLGNLGRQLVEIKNLDNTIPTITNVTETVSGGNLTLTVTANDRNASLNKEGSGVVAYAVTTNEIIPDENSSVWKTTNVLTVPQGTRYYVWAKDRVGNISGSWKYDGTYIVPTQIETTSSNVTFANYSITVQDKESGLSEIIWYYKKANETEYTKESRIIKQRPYSPYSNTETGITNATEYKKQLKFKTGEKYNLYVEIYDGAGNKKTSSVKTVSAFTVNDRQYSITYNLNGGSVATANPTKYRITSNDIILNNPTKTGHTFTGWTEKINNLDWIKGYINQNNGLLETNSSYPNSYYSGAVSLRNGETYTVSGYNNANNIRWMIYDKNANFVGKSSGTSYKATSDCFVMILYIGDKTNYSTEEQRNETVVVQANNKIAMKIEKGSAGNREYVANWKANPYRQIVQVRYQNADGSYGNYTNVIDRNYDYGTNVSWSRKQDDAYKAASISYTVTGVATKQVSVDRNTYTQKVQVRYQNADGTYGSYSDVINKTYRYEETVSWSRAQDAKYSAASISYKVEGTATKKIDVNRRTYTQKVQVRYQNADGTYGNYSDVINKAYRYEETVSWSRNQDVRYKAASVSYTVSGANTKQINVDRRTYTATFDGNGGSNGGSITKRYEEALGTLPTASKTGYSLKGWYTQRTDGSKISNTTKMTENVTYYAQWVDDIAPTVPTDIDTIDRTTNAIEVKARGSTDAGSGMQGYQYSINGTNWSNTIAEGTSYKFTNLTSGTTFTVYARAVDKANNKSGNKTSSISTKSTELPLFANGSFLNGASKSRGRLASGSTSVYERPVIIYLGNQIDWSGYSKLVVDVWCDRGATAWIKSNDDVSKSRYIIKGGNGQDSNGRITFDISDLTGKTGRYLLVWPNDQSNQDDSYAYITYIALSN